MEPRRKLLQLDLRDVQFRLGAFQSRGHRGIGSRASIPEGAVEQLLDLRQPPPDTVPQLLLKAAALGVARLEDPASGSVQLSDPASHLGLHPHVRQGDPRR
jgi:hypothetical protein